MDQKDIETLFDLFKEKQDTSVSQLDFDTLFCQRLVRATSAQEASIWEMGSDGRLTLQYGTNISSDEAQRFSLMPGEGISGAAVLSRKTVSVSDAWTDHQHSRHVDEAIQFRTRSMISAPILFKDRLYGVINILNHTTKDRFPVVWEGLMTAVGMLYAALLIHRGKKGDKFPLTKKITMAQPGKTIVVGVSRAIQDVLDLSMKAARSKVPVLIYGETGTGKELAARRIHENMDHSTGQFFSINCAAINETILESELFGHVKGAFSGASSNRKGKFVAASGGTLFLDEIGEMSLSCQVKILRALQEKKVMPVGSDTEVAFDARIIAATNTNLEQLIRKGKFRQDLYFRLCGLELHIPKLCDRRSDIPLLVDYFIQKGLFEKQVGMPHPLFPAISPPALDLLINYPWPGNIRQLEQAIFAALAICDNQVILVSDLPGWLTRPLHDRVPGNDSKSEPVQDIVAQSEKIRYVQALNDTCYEGTGRWNVSAAARLLNIPRK
ncbi:MAG: sigma-54-dependent Fis family transcriptional regulator, partial [Proteobacteria bacterium]|nr:sigma-54-dependent Fis family transcriptional regulator [Pseudomonadota bacterium]